jgi:hypothetical protein
MSGATRRYKKAERSVEISVENRDYHHLSQNEISGGKRISQHLSENE